MNRRFIFQIAVALICAVLATPVKAALVMVLTIEGAIGPATADYAVRGIAFAERSNAQLIVLAIDTPGGLDPSMRTIIKAILASPVPVAAYVSPGGARAASAGTFILYASHVAAMAPGTNLGAATPVQIGGPSAPGEPDRPARKPEQDGKSGAEKPAPDITAQPMTRKQVNDAAAYIRGLAQMRKRNAEWAEKAVREAVSLPAQEALKLGVIDHVATDLGNLLEQIDGSKVQVQGREQPLQTAAANIVHYRPDWRVKLLSVITDPSIALILLAIGVYGLLFEFMTPGMVLPGVLGAIFLLLALYALQLLPVNYAGLGLILLGLLFMASEAFLPSGVLGLGGIIAFVIGAVILIDTELPGFGIPAGLIASVAVLSALLIATIAGIALKTRRRVAVIGEHDLIGVVAEVASSAADGGWVRIHGENWRATSGTSLRPGQKVRVQARNGLVLQVTPINSQEKGE